MISRAVVKRWGNSLGIVLPKDMVEKEELSEDTEILVDVVKKADISFLFGSLERKMSGQKFKDMVREGWKR